MAITRREFIAASSAGVVVSVTGLSSAAKEVASQRPGTFVRASTDWFRDCGWGVFTHFLADKATTPEAWNQQVADFDVDGLADQLELVGARYYFMTIGQNSGHYCAPNLTYDSFVGTKPSKCSRRDLVSDLCDALTPKGIKLLVYLPSGAPAQDPIAVEKLEWQWGYEGQWGTGGTKRTGKRLGEFQKKWESVVREWALRWGTKVCGWWIDGCYFADEMYRHEDPPNFKSFVEALKAGNPDSIIAFGSGVRVPVTPFTEYEEYTAGEVSEALPVCPGRWVNAAQYHILSYLGETWGKGSPRFPSEFVTGYTKLIIARGGVITWDVPIEKNGLLPEVFVRQLEMLKKECL